MEVRPYALFIIYYMFFGKWSYNFWNNKDGNVYNIFWKKSPSRAIHFWVVFREQHEHFHNIYTQHFLTWFQ